MLLTDHVYEEVDKDGVHIVIKPVYEWCTERLKTAFDSEFIANLQ